MKKLQEPSTHTDYKTFPLNDTSTSPRAFSVRRELKLMLSMSIPLVVSYSARNIMVSTDYAFVGHISNVTHPDAKYDTKEYLAASALATLIMRLIITPPLAFNRVLNSLVSQAVGAKKFKMAGMWLQASLFWVGITTIPFLFMFPFVGNILHLLGFSKTICDLAAEFAMWSIFWPIPNAWYQCLRFYFQAQRIVRPAMYNNAVFVAINALLGWVFVFGGPFWYICGWRGLGFIGSPISLSISRCLQPLAYWLYMIYYRKAHKKTWSGWSWDFLERQRLKKFMGYAIPKIGTMLFKATVSKSITLMIGHLGDLPIAASTAIIAAVQVWSGGLICTVQTLASIRSGFYLGAGDGQAAKKACQLVMILLTVNCAIVCPIMYMFGHLILKIVTIETSVQNLAYTLFPVVFLTKYLSFIVQIITSGIFSSQGRNKLSTYLSFGFEIPFSIGTSAILIFYFHYQLLTIYWGLCIVTFVEAIVVILIVQRSNWTQYAIEARERQEANKLKEPIESK